MIDIERVRRETPACEKIIHFNNAGASLTPTCVLDSVKNHLDLEQSIGGYEAAYRLENELKDFYSNTAKLIGAKPKEIAFIENATRAWDMIFYSIPFKKGDKIITGNAEYASNYIAMIQLSKKLGIEIEVIPDDSDGQIDLKALKRSIDDRVKLIALTHVPTNNGLINPAIDVGKIAKDANIYYLLDACQSLGQINVDVSEIGCDFLCGTGRKYLRGPRGTGMLYIRESLIEKIEPVFLDLHAAKWTAMNEYEIRKDARRFENWEYYVAGKLGLSRAIAYCNEIGISNIEERVTKLASLLRSKLSSISGVKLLDRGKTQSGIVTFHTSVDAEHLHKRLEDDSINTSISYLEYARLDLEPKGLSMVSRASIHYFNTEEEIEPFCSKLTKIVQQN